MNLKITSLFICVFTLLIAFGIVNPNHKQSTVASTTLSDVSNSFLNKNIHHKEDYCHQVEIPPFKENEASKTSIQLSLLPLTLSQLIQQYISSKKHSRNTESLGTLEESRLLYAPHKLHDDSDLNNDQLYTVLPIYETIIIHKQLPKLRHNFNQLKQNVFIQKESVRNTKKINKGSIDTKHIGYWQTVYSIESKQGKLLYRPKNKSRNCNNTSGPCGHHQLTVQALKDIGCNSLQCRKDRLDFKKSLNLSKKLLALNEKRLKNNGITKLKDYQKYLIHQQGAYGIKNIIAATKGQNVLSMTIKKNMANNSPFSYKQLKNMGSKTAAKKFMQHWEKKWVDEKLLIVASQTTSATNDNLIKKILIPTLNNAELILALNIKF